MDPSLYDELVGSLRGLLIALNHTLSPKEAAEVEHYIDHAELGEALRTLAWIIIEEDKKIPHAIVKDIEQLADSMDIRDNLPPGLVG